MASNLFSVRITSAAESDLLGGFRFYQKQQEGLGHYFIDSLYSDIDSLCFLAGTNLQTYKQLHRALAKRFPYAIYYKFDQQIVYVVAVLDCRQRPASIRQRLL